MGHRGTTGRPTAFAIGRKDWRAIANAHARVMWGMGMRPGDIVFVGGDLQPLYGLLGALAGAERLGARPSRSAPAPLARRARCAQWLDR